jgi:hypothetical protein
MTALAIIGFVAIVLCALYVSAGAVSVLFGELAFAGRLSPLSFVLSAIALALWALAAWLSPFTVTLGVSA